MKGKRLNWSGEELAWIEAHASLPRREAWVAFVGRFGREDVKLGAFCNLCKRRGWKTGRTGRIEKGAVSWNKGRKMPFNANRARTQFRKGQLPHNTRYAGHERVNRQGYVEVSIDETNPHTGFERRYVHKHRWLWEQANGPVPEGHALKSLDGDRLNTDPSNWVAIPRAMLPRLNGIHGRGYDEAEPEVKPAIMLATRLEHELSRRGKSRRKS